MRTYIKRSNGDCWSGEEWINLNVAPGARDACDFESYAAAAGYLDDALAGDESGNFAEARVVTVEHDDEVRASIQITGDGRTIEATLGGEAFKFRAHSVVFGGREYRIAYMLEATGEFDVVETFEAADDAAANAYAEANHEGEWYVLDEYGNNING